MPDNENGEGGGSGIFSRMTTAELEELIRQIPLEHVDFNYWNAVMEVYAGREDAQHADTEAAWQEFQEKYSEGQTALSDVSREKEDEQASHPSRPHAVRRHRRLLHASLVTAMLAALLIAGTITASALGFDLWRTLANWTSEHFSFSPGVETSYSDSKHTIDERYSDLQKALDNCGVKENVVPSYLPEGYEQKELKTTNSGNGTRVICLFEHGENAIVFQYIIADSPTGGIYTKDEGEPVQYEVNGIVHYIMTNAGLYKTVWANGNIECSFSGADSMEQMTKMIDSIYT